MDKFDLLHKQVEGLGLKVDTVVESIQSIDKTLAVNTESLVHHVRRTDQLQDIMEQFKKDLAPVEKHVHAINVILKVLAGLAGAVTLTYYALQIYQHISSLV
jgi:hypothetical protein